MIVASEIGMEDDQRVIDFDTQFMIEGSGLPMSDSPPPLTLNELEVARERGDRLFWIKSLDGEKAGYYWIEEKSDCLFLSGVVISTQFRNRGIGRQVLAWVDQEAQKRDLKKSALAVSPINTNALHLYLSHGYRIVRCDENYFGTASPGKFRLILEKELHLIPKANDKNESLEIPSTAYAELMCATKNGFVGVSLKVADNKTNQGTSILFLKPGIGT